MKDSAKGDIIDSTKTAVHNYLPVLTAVISPFLASYPFWAIAFYSAIGLYGVYLAINQKALNEVIKLIKDNPEKFREEIVNSEEFRMGFLVFIDNYIKQRNFRKKQIIQGIFLGFTSSEDKAHYEIERINDCLERISVESLELLDFLNKNIFAQIDKDIEIELSQELYQKSDRSIEWWRERRWETKSVWLPVEMWLRENYNSNSDKVKKQYEVINAGWPSDLLHRVQNQEQEKTGELLECFNEMVTLGVLRMRSGGSGGTDYSFTKFGRKFCKIVIYSS